MRVTLRRSGGFAAIPGLDVRVGLDSQQLGPEDALQLESAVRQAQLQQFGVPCSPVPDGRTYRLEIEDDAGSYVAQVADPLPTQAVRDLVSLLLSRGVRLT